jgi:hypothetical protein
MLNAGLSGGNAFTAEEAAMSLQEEQAFELLHRREWRAPNELANRRAAPMPESKKPRTGPSG